MKTRAAVLREMGLSAPYAKSRPLTIETFDLDEPETGEVLVEIVSAGLCHSDLSVIDGSRPRVMPMVLGHEAAGIVRQLGPGVRGLAEGDHVVFGYVPCCGYCSFCGCGRAALCVNAAKANTEGSLLRGGRRFTDASGTRMNHHLGVSGYSQFTVASQESLVKIKPKVPLEIAALFGCAILTGVGAVVNTAKVEPGRSVAVFGMGGVGLSSVMGAKAAGANPIIAVDLLDDKLQLAKELGATHTVNASTHAPVKEIRELTNGGADYCFESVGNEKVLLQAYESTGRGGVTVTMGLPHPSKQLSIPAVSLVAEERALKGSYMGSSVPSRDIPRFIGMYEAGLLPVEKLQTHTLGLDELNEGFDRLHKAQAVRQIVRMAE